MSLFDDLKTISFSTGTWTKRHDEIVHFCEREGRMYVLLSDLWRLCEMEGDKASIVGVYVKAMGRAAAQHFILKAAVPEDALISNDVASRMVSDWMKDAEDHIFHRHPIQHMFDEARRAMHGIEIIRSIFERLREGRYLAPRFDATHLRLEVDMTARAMLSNWGANRKWVSSSRQGAGQLSPLSDNSASRCAQSKASSRRFSAVLPRDGRQGL